MFSIKSAYVEEGKRSFIYFPYTVTVHMIQNFSVRFKFQVKLHGAYVLIEEIFEFERLFINRYVYHNTIKRKDVKGSTFMSNEN